MPGQNHLIVDLVYRCEIDVVLLDNARIQGIEVHDQDILIPQAPPRLEHKATFVLIPLAFGGFCAFLVVLVGLSLEDGCRLLAVGFIGTNVLESMKLVK
jgi:hypothetical protein